MNVYRDEPLLRVLSDEELAALLAPFAGSVGPSLSVICIRRCPRCGAWVPAASDVVDSCRACGAPLLC